MLWWLGVQEFFNILATGPTSLMGTGCNTCPGLISVLWAFHLQRMRGMLYGQRKHCGLGAFAQFTFWILGS